ncbi:MAG: glycoside hydrolase family 125 protein [Aristaeellaceae bacterium]
MSAASAVARRLQALEPVLSPVEGLYGMFRKCFLNTLETTVRHHSPGDTFIITGDIEAMWLRDSTAQVLHYLRFLDIPELRQLVEGLIARQAECIILDPYANAFNLTDSGGDWITDLPRHSGWVWERKYEIDSLAYPMLLAGRFHQRTGSTAFLMERFHQAMKTIVGIWTVEQRHEGSPYWFMRANCPPSDTLSNVGRGAPTGYTGMTWSGFRPSDDACVYGYLIPSNLFAAQALTCIASFARLVRDEPLERQAQVLEGQIRAGVEQFGLYQHPNFGEIYAYEVDGLGHQLLMDDANVPSLLSLPYLGVCAPDDPRYLRTRSFVLSRHNPNYHSGRYAQGVGSPHTPQGYVWPIALCVQAMTATSVSEAAAILRMLLDTHAGTGFMHESFNPDAPERYTRAWFAWANSMFGEMICQLYEQGRLPEVIKAMNA